MGADQSLQSYYDTSDNMPHQPNREKKGTYLLQNDDESNKNMKFRNVIYPQEPTTVPRRHSHSSLDSILREDPFELKNFRADEFNIDAHLSTTTTTNNTKNNNHMKKSVSMDHNTTEARQISKASTTSSSSSSDNPNQMPQNKGSGQCRTAFVLPVFKRKKKPSRSKTLSGKLLSYLLKARNHPGNKSWCSTFLNNYIDIWRQTKNSVLNFQSFCW